MLSPKRIHHSLTGEGINTTKTCCFRRHQLPTMPALLSLPMRRILAPILYRAMSSGYLVHEPKYAFLKVCLGQGGSILCHLHIIPGPS